MNYFVLSSIHEYILDISPNVGILEILNVYKPSRCTDMIVTFTTNDGIEKMTVSGEKFYYDYYEKHKLSISYLYSVVNKKFGARILLSNIYLNSLNLNVSTNRQYNECLCVNNLHPKIEDYFILNSFFHTFKWKSILEQKLLLTCRMDSNDFEQFKQVSKKNSTKLIDIKDTTYAQYRVLAKNKEFEQFKDLVKSVVLIEQNSNTFKRQIVNCILNCDEPLLIDTCEKFYMIKRYTDSQNIKYLTLLGVYLWLMVNESCSADLSKLVNKLIKSQNVEYPYGVLELENYSTIKTTLSNLFSKAI